MFLFLWNNRLCLNCINPIICKLTGRNLKLKERENRIKLINITNPYNIDNDKERIGFFDLKKDHNRMEFLSKSYRYLSIFKNLFSIFLFRLGITLGIITGNFMLLKVILILIAMRYYWDNIKYSQILNNSRESLLNFIFLNRDNPDILKKPLYLDIRYHGNYFRGISSFVRNNFDFRFMDRQNLDEFRKPEITILMYKTINLANWIDFNDITYEEFHDFVNKIPKSTLMILFEYIDTERWLNKLVFKFRLPAISLLGFLLTWSCFPVSVLLLICFWISLYFVEDYLELKLSSFDYIDLVKTTHIYLKDIKNVDILRKQATTLLNHLIITEKLDAFSPFIIPMPLDKICDSTWIKILGHYLILKANNNRIHTYLIKKTEKWTLKKELYASAYPFLLGVAAGITFLF